MKPLHFQKAARRLLSHLYQRWPLQDLDLDLFEQRALDLLTRTQYRTTHNENTPGYLEWSDFYAKMTVSWFMVKDTPQVYGLLVQLRQYLGETLGIRPRNGAKRWLRDTEERCRGLLSRCNTLAEAKAELAGLLDNDSHYKEAYREIYDKLLTEQGFHP